jgi:hypothetical protein
VPVHDVGSTEDYPCFVVSKFIEGCTLAKKIEDDRPPFGEAAELTATVAEALHYAHRKGLVHRDIKPGNILLDTDGKPYVADFGLALKEENVGKGPNYAGTPAYMSPEQARGEGNRVDGRSDIFSLGVIFYELLTGRRPFRADSFTELLEQISTLESRPPRQVDDAIPQELERICLKALTKRASERYTTARDMADDLRHFLASGSDFSPQPKRSRLLWLVVALPILTTALAFFFLPALVRSFGARVQEPPLRTVSTDLAHPPIPNPKEPLSGMASEATGLTPPNSLPAATISTDLRLTRIRLASEDCNWESTYHDGRIVGFREYRGGKCKHPIFDIIVENVSSHDIVVHSAALEVGNVMVDTFPHASAPSKALEVTAEYEWKLTHFKDPAFTAWMKKHPNRGFEDIYKEVLHADFELDPPLAIGSGGSARFRVKFVDGYDWPCQIRFVFREGVDRSVTSEWFEFHPRL